MKKSLRIKQQDMTDCGAACLSSVAAYHGLHITVGRLRPLAGTDRKGTNVLGMVEAAVRMGFQAKGVRATEEGLRNIPMPAIAHVVRDGLQHFVVLYRLKGNRITWMDPQDGEGHTEDLPIFLRQWSGVLILMSPTESFVPGRTEESTGRRFFRLLRPHRSLLAQAFFGAVLYSILGLSTSIYVEKIVDQVLGNGNLNLLHLMSVAMLAVLLARTGIGGMKSLLALRTGQLIDASLILGYYRHLLALPQPFFDTMRTGEILSRINDAVKIRYFINNVSLDLAVNLIILICTLGLMFLQSWKMALVTLAFFPLFALLYRLYDRFNRKATRQVMEDGAELEAQWVESIGGVGTIKRFGMEPSVNRKTERRFLKLLQSTYRIGSIGIVAGSASQLLAGGLTIAILWIGCTLVFRQELTAGTLMSFYALTGYLLSPLLNLVGANQSVQDALVAADRLFQILDREQEASDEGKVELSPERMGDIRIQGLSFRYGTRRLVFDGFDLTIRKGQTTALVGESGSGKSTLAALLQNIYTPQTGRISIGDLDLRFISNQSLRRMVATVPQEVQLFSGSILENIATGEDKPDLHKVIRLCDELGIRTFIESLPEAYSTILGDHGLSLSGGERQRIAIARALYKNPEILVFDEATSSLDSHSEQKVKQVFRTWSLAGKTILLIAHRMSTIVDADHIVLLRQGRVAEQGNHRELLGLGGEYAKLWNQNDSSHAEAL